MSNASSAAEERAEERIEERIEERAEERVEERVLNAGDGDVGEVMFSIRIYIIKM